MLAVSSEPCSTPTSCSCPVCGGGAVPFGRDLNWGPTMVDHCCPSCHVAWHDISHLTRGPRWVDWNELPEQRVG